MQMGPIEGSETSAIRTKTPGYYPKENILHIEHGESLKSRIQEKLTLLNIFKFVTGFLYMDQMCVEKF